QGCSQELHRDATGLIDRREVPHIANVFNSGRLEPANPEHDPESANRSGQPVRDRQIDVKPVEQLVQPILITVWYQALIFIGAKGPEKAGSDSRVGMDNWCDKPDEHPGVSWKVTPRDSRHPSGCVWLVVLQENGQAAQSRATIPEGPPRSGVMDL